MRPFHHFLEHGSSYMSRQAPIPTTSSDSETIEYDAQPAAERMEKCCDDVESQLSPPEPGQGNKSVYQSLGILDRLLALWILLAIILGILLGNYVDGIGRALQSGRFAQVSAPIGMCLAACV